MDTVSSNNHFMSGFRSTRRTFCRIFFFAHSIHSSIIHSFTYLLFYYLSELTVNYIFVLLIQSQCAKRIRISFNYTHSHEHTHMHVWWLLPTVRTDHRSNVGNCELFEINAVAGSRERIAVTNALRLFQILDRWRFFLSSSTFYSEINSILNLFAPRSNEFPIRKWAYIDCACGAKCSQSSPSYKLVLLLSREKIAESDEKQFGFLITSNFLWPNEPACNNGFWLSVPLPLPDICNQTFCRRVAATRCTT